MSLIWSLGSQQTVNYIIETPPETANDSGSRGAPISGVLSND